MTPTQPPGLRADERELPPLPQPTLEDHDYELWGQNVRGDFFTAEQMHAYARAALTTQPATSEERSELVQQLRCFEGSDALGNGDFSILHKAADALAQPVAPVAVPDGARVVIEKCRDALAEELGAWDIDPPLFHVKEAHEACEAWLSAPQPPASESAAQQAAEEFGLAPLSDVAACPHCFGPIDATPATQPAEPSELVDLLQRAVRRLEIEHSHGGSIMREWITEARAALAQHGAGKAGK